MFSKLYKYVFLFVLCVCMSSMYDCAQAAEVPADYFDYFKAGPLVKSYTGIVTDMMTTVQESHSEDQYDNIIDRFTIEAYHICVDDSTWYFYYNPSTPPFIKIGAVVDVEHYNMYAGGYSGYCRVKLIDPTSDAFLDHVTFTDNIYDRFHYRKRPS